MLYTKKLYQLLFIDITNLNLCVVRVVKYKIKDKFRQEKGEDTDVHKCWC